MKKNSPNLNLISRIAILLLVLLLSVGTTFSWYDRTKRDDETGYFLSYDVDGKVNSGLQSVSVQTYLGTKEDGIVKYSEVPLTTSGVGESVTTTSGEITYFKTVITDSANAGDSLVSLYLSQFSCASAMGSSVHVGIIGPEKTYNKYTTATTSGGTYVIQPMLIEDNILLKNNATVEVYWFLQVDKAYTGDGTVNLGVPYVVNN